MCVLATCTTSVLPGCAVIGLRKKNHQAFSMNLCALICGKLRYLSILFSLFFLCRCTQIMSKATKRKYVVKEVLDDFILPASNQKIVRVLSGRGNNLHEVEDTEGEKFLVSMPTKFRRNVWIKRGDFLVVEPIEEGDKVKAEIVHILYKHQIKYIQDEGQWPKEFSEEENKTGIRSENDINVCNGSESEDDLFINTNRLNAQLSLDSSDDDSEEEESSGETDPEDDDGDNSSQEEECTK